MGAFGQEKKSTLDKLKKHPEQRVVLAKLSAWGATQQSHLEGHGTIRAAISK